MYHKIDETEVADGLKLLPGEMIELAFSTQIPQKFKSEQTPEQGHRVTTRERINGKLVTKVEYITEESELIGPANKIYFTNKCIIRLEGATYHIVPYKDVICYQVGQET